MPELTMFQQIVEELIDEEVELINELIEEEIQPLMDYRVRLEKEAFNKAYKELKELEEV